MSVSRRRVLVFYAATMLFWFCLYTYVPILTPYVEHLGGSLFMAGLIVGSYGFAQLLVRVPIGIWSDRLGTRKVFLLAGFGFALASSLGFALSGSVWMALVSRALAGVAAGSWVAFTVLFAGYFPPDEAPKAMGVISFYTSAAQMAATALGGLAAQMYGWRAPFFLGAAGGLCGLLIALWIAEPKRAARSSLRAAELLKMGGEWPLLSVSLLAVLAQGVTFTTMFGFTPLYAAHLGADKGALGLLTLLSTLANAVAGYISGTLVARLVGERLTAAAGFFIGALGTAAIPLVHTVPLLLATQAVNGFGQGLSMPILMGLAIRSIASERRATAMGFFQAIYSLGMFGGPVFVGWAGGHIGLAGGFFCMSLVSLAAAALCIAWILPGRRRAAAPESVSTLKQTGI